jgi:hypothetical protein
MRRLPAIAAVCGVLAGVAGCGGSGGSASSSTSSASPAAAATSTRTAAAPVSTTRATRSRPQSKSGPALPARAYGSIASYGHEAAGGDRTAVVAALHGYLAAIAAGNWPTACGDLSSTIERQLAAVLARADGSGGDGCARALQALIGRTPQSLRRAQMRVRVIAVRTDGDRAFVLYRSPVMPRATISMLRESGRWTAGVLANAPGG